MSPSGPTRPGPDASRTFAAALLGHVVDSAGEAQCNFHVTHLPSGESWAVRRRLTEWLHLEERMSLESGKLVARPMVQPGPTLQGRRSSGGLAALFVSRGTETRRQMDRLQARLSEMLCDDSLKASAALQDFLGLQAPEMPSSVRIVKLSVPWEDEATGIESAEVHVEVSTHGMDSDAAYAMPTHVVASVLCLEPPAGDSQLREIVVPANSPATLVIDGLQPSSMYEFQVRATNSLGQSPSVCIRVLVPPRPEMSMSKMPKDSKMDHREGALSLPEMHSEPLAAEFRPQPGPETSTVAEPRVDSALGSVLGSSADQRMVTEGVDASAVEANVTGNGAAESSASSTVRPAEDQGALSLPETHSAPSAAELALDTSTVAEPRVDSALGSVLDSSADQRMVTEGVDASAVEEDVTGNGAAESVDVSPKPLQREPSGLQGGIPFQTPASDKGRHAEPSEQRHLEASVVPDVIQLEAKTETVDEQGATEVERREIGERSVMDSERNSKGDSHDPKESGVHGNGLEEAL
eukprot:s85_g25.t1